MRLLILLCLLLLPAACMSPAAREAPDRPDAAGSAELPPALVEHAAGDPAARAFAQRVTQRLIVRTGQPPAGGNRLELLLDGPATHRAQLAAIAKARHHVHLMSYIMTDDKIGQQYLEVMGERARKGVKVRVMFDDLGSRGAEDPFRDALKKAGVEVHAYAPVKSQFWRVSQRNHRKVLVVDGRDGFIGGISISDDYRRSAGVRLGGSQGSEQGWRDTQVRIEGPAVTQLQHLFIAQWRREAGDIEDDPRYWPEARTTGNQLVMVAANKGDLVPATGGEQAEDNDIYGAYVDAMTASRDRIWITQAYFAPDAGFVEALTGAARRGVDVRLIVPGNSDVTLLLHAARHYYARLLEAGVRIFEFQGPVLHAKTAVIDSVWSTVGSSNLDFRSFIHNDEANAIVISEDFAREMERMFEADQQRAKEIAREQWEQRPLVHRMREAVASAFRYWI